MKILTGTEIRDRFNAEWGVFRRWVSSNPISGVLVGVGVGLLAGLYLAAKF